MSEGTPEPLPRQTGEEQGKPCPTCGTSRSLLHNDDGSTSPAPCPKCFGAKPLDDAVTAVTGPNSTLSPQVAPLSQSASEEAPPRSVGTEVTP
jgi:hypothetical protein